MYKITNVLYEWFFTFELGPKIILCLTIGYIFNEKLVGLHKAILIFVGALILGQGLITLSAHYGIYSIAIIGRLIQGMALEC